MRTILLLTGIQSAMADSPNVPLMSEEQVRACQQGNMDVLASYLGPDNPVVMVCVYKVEWEPLTSKSGKGTLITYATVVRSVDQAFPVGTKIKWISYLERAIPQKMLEQCLSKEGELFYIINPWKKQRKEDQDIAHAQDDIPEISYSFNFLIAYPYYYNNLRAMLDIPVQKVPADWPDAGNGIQEFHSESHRHVESADEMDSECVCQDQFHDRERCKYTASCYW